MHWTIAHQLNNVEKCTMSDHLLITFTNNQQPKTNKNNSINSMNSLINLLNLIN